MKACTVYLPINSKYYNKYMSVKEVKSKVILNNARVSKRLQDGFVLTKESDSGSKLVDYL